MRADLAEPAACVDTPAEVEGEVLDAVFDAQAALLMVLDADGRLLRMNPSCESLSGYRGAEFRGGLAWLELFCAADREAARRGMDSLRGGADQFRLQAPWHCRDGGVRVVTWTFASLRKDGGALHRIVASGFDVTAERRAQETVNAQLDTLRRLDRLLTAGELAAHIAHEVNQPLSAITAYGEATRHLLEGGAPRERLMANLEKIGQQALRAGNIIKLLRGPVRMHAIDSQPTFLDTLVERARALCEPFASPVGVELVLDVDSTLPPVAASPLHVEYVLVNLVRNAVEAVHAAGVQGGRVAIMTRRVDDIARVSVRDNGPGVSALEAAQLFDVFHTTRPTGLGLGLRCSRRVIEALHGQIWAEPAQSGGLFHFTLPFAT